MGLTIEERNFITKNIGTMSVSKIAEALNMPYRNVYYYANRAGLVNKSHKFTAEEDNFIKVAYNHMSAEKIAEMLGLSVSCVYNRSRTLGVRKFKRG